MSLPTYKVHAFGFRLVVFGLLILGGYCFNMWQPKRQIELHQKNFLLALEDRNWRRVNAFLAADYSDRFGHDRATVVKDLRDVLRQFFAVTIRAQGTQTDHSPGRATITTNITVSGTGPGLTDFITTEVNRLTTPWVFSWRRASFLPWDWQLEKVDNAGLNVPERGSNL